RLRPRGCLLRHHEPPALAVAVVSLAGTVVRLGEHENVSVGARETGDRRAVRTDDGDPPCRAHAVGRVRRLRLRVLTHGIARAEAAGAARVDADLAAGEIRGETAAAVQVHDAALALQTARAGPEAELVGHKAVRSVQAGIGHPAALLHADDDAGVAVADGIAIDEGIQVAIRTHRSLVRHLPARCDRQGARAVNRHRRAEAAAAGAAAHRLGVRAARPALAGDVFGQ